MPVGEFLRLSLAQLARKRGLPAQETLGFLG